MAATVTGSEENDAMSNTKTGPWFLRGTCDCGWHTEGEEVENGDRAVADHVNTHDGPAFVRTEVYS